MDLHKFFNSSNKAEKKPTSDHGSTRTSSRDGSNKGDDDDFQVTPMPPKGRKRKATDDDENQLSDAVENNNKKQKQKQAQEIDPKDFFAAAKKSSAKPKAPKSRATPVNVTETNARNMDVKQENKPKETEKKVDLTVDDAKTTKDSAQIAIDLTKDETSKTEITSKITESTIIKKEKEVEEVKVAGNSEKHNSTLVTVKDEKGTSSVNNPIVTSDASVSKNRHENTPKLEQEAEVENSGQNTTSRPVSLKAEGPRALGTRRLPRGQTSCLKGIIIAFTGVLDTMTNDTAVDIVKRYGGQITSDVTNLTTHLIRGRNAATANVAKAKKFNIKILDEDGFYKLVENSRPAPTTAVVASPSNGKGKQKVGPAANATQQSTAQLWTDKYRPKTINEIMGNKEIVKRISNWLENWQKSYRSGFPKTKTDDGIGGYKAVLISGPPGIGKTTAAHVIGVTHGYEVLEYNASDVRSKKALEDNILEMIDNRTMTEFLNGSAKQVKERKKVLLVMDEVDGMSGGDRGGSVELAAMIKKSKIPIICICNDVRSQKVAPILRVCYDARFKRTPAKQLLARFMTIAHREKLSISPAAIEELVNATGNDIRQITNILSTYRLSAEKLDVNQAKALGKTNEKNTQMNIFDVPRTLFNSSSSRELSLAQKQEIYFQDYSLVPLMVAENYPSCIPDKATRLAKTGNPKEIATLEMKLYAEAAESIADGDMIDAAIHGSVLEYSLLPVHSIFSCIRPAASVCGTVTGRTNFPSWLGQNSKAGKHQRLLEDMQARMRLTTATNKDGIRQDYIPALNQRIFSYVKDEKYEDAIKVMDAYHLERETLETLSDFDMSGKKPLSQLSAKQKRAFSKMYNGSPHPTVIQVGLSGIKKGKGTKGNAAVDIQDSDEESDDRYYGGYASEEDEIFDA